MNQTQLAVAFWCLVVAALAVLVLLARQRHITTRIRKQNSALQGDLRVRDEEMQHLASVRLPALADFSRHPATPVPGPLHQQLDTTQYAQGLHSVMGLFSDSVETTTDRVDQSAKATLKSMMRTVQSLANEQQLAISSMEDRYDDPHVLEDLLKIDHANSQLGRRVQATAVLCGSWPGQQRSASSLSDIVRGATSRIRDYRRVQVHTQIESAVVSRAVEPVVLTVAEVLDNGARHSQPNTSVEVNFQPAHNGMAIVVDDAGVGMNAEELERAARLLNGRQTVDINKLGDPPQVGFAVIGVLAARYGFSVSVDTRSPYGGVRAVVFLPTALLTHIENKPQPAPAAPAETHRPRVVDTPRRSAVEPSTAATAPPRTADDETPTEALTVSGLPKRRRHQPSDGQKPPAGQSEPAPAASQPARPARQTAAGMGAWQRGTRSGRITGLTDSEGNPQA